jgi:FkbM family methyltransferase
MEPTSASKPKRRNRWIFSGWEIFFMALPLAGVASLHISKAPLFWTIYATGRAEGCSLERAVDVEGQLNRMTNWAKRMNEESRIVERESNGLHLNRWATPWGEFWAPPSTSVPFLLAEQSMRVYGDGPRRVQPGDVVIDCGANVGTFTREALNAGAAKVISVEPSEGNVESLRRNFAAEIAAGRVVVYPKGVWHREEVLEFSVYDNSALDSFVMRERNDSETKAHLVKLPVTTVDKIVAELKLEKVHFIKMDIEGAERHALRGATGTISRFRPRMSIATENLADDPKVVPEVVKEVAPGYRQECGPCALVSLTRMHPDILYYIPQ